MKQLVYSCDKCGKPITKDIYRLYVGIVSPETDDAPECYELNGLGEAVFCSKCLAEIDKEVVNSIEKNDRLDKIIEEASAKKDLPSKGKTKKKKPIDDGKIAALRDGGWTLEAIAEELGCCPQTIANRLNAMGMK